jgi:lysozyme
MRPRLLAALLLASAGLAGCMSSNMTAALDVGKPSPEITSSVRPSADGPVQARPQPVVGLAQEQEIQLTALADSDELDTRAVAAVSMVAPPLQQSRRVIRQEVHRTRFSDAHPINFGRKTPKDYPVHGVDVSRWQGEINWPKLRAQGANFVYIKATDGGDHLDPMFKKNWREAHAAGLKRGAYHFFYWCRTGASQADWFIRNVPKVEGALPPVIDVEWNHLSNCKRRPPRAEVLEKMQVFMDRLEAHYGQRPIIYTAPDFYADNLKGAFPNHPFWLRAVAQHPSKVYPGRDWVFWQYSGSGLSKGVKGKIDLNVFHGTVKEWHRWLGGQTLVASSD